MQTYTTPRRYVLGFIFNSDMTQVLLIQKNRTERQKEKWNGIGGKVEPGETPHQAMVREGNEEATMLVAVEDIKDGTTGWNQFCRFNSIKSGVVHEITCFKLVGDSYLDGCRPGTDEGIKAIPVKQVLFDDAWRAAVMKTVTTLLVLARQGMESDVSQFELVVTKQLPQPLPPQSRAALIKSMEHWERLKEGKWDAGKSIEIKAAAQIEYDFLVMLLDLDDEARSAVSSPTT